MHGSQVEFINVNVYLSLKIVFIKIANHPAFHLRLHFLLNYLFTGIKNSLIVRVQIRNLEEIG